MRRLAAVLLAGCAWLAVAPPVRAEIHRIDDSASQVLAANVRMAWDTAAPQHGAAPTVSGAVGVLVRLDTSPWAGRHGRIHLTLPPQPNGEVTASWTTHGRLLPGMLRSGERTLVYAGLLPPGLLEDILQLTVRADGGRLTRAEQLTFTFEVDLESP